MLEQIVIIGTGRLPCSCLEQCLGQGRKLVCIEPENQDFSPLNAACRRNNIDYRLITDRGLLASFFSSVKVPTLVVSAYNAYLFPETVLENPNLVIVNFHNSLLPRHRGRNAPTWAIFELDEVTGITWHGITKRIDAGEIIARKAIPISDRITALQLTLRTLEVGAEVFGQIVHQLIRGEYQATTLVANGEGKPHRSQEAPNGGNLDLSWSVKKISAFLRSMDYGKFKVFPNPRVSVLGSSCEISSYRLEESNLRIGSQLAMAEKALSIRGDGLGLEITMR